MAFIDLDHVNIRSANLEALIRFYEDVLGLKLGDRPPFPFGGAWLYCGDRAVVHLVETTAQPESGDPQIEHFAFRARDLPAFQQVLKAHKLPHETVLVPGNGNTQVFLRDPDGNKVEVQFAAEESAQTTPSYASRSMGGSV